MRSIVSYPPSGHYDSQIGECGITALAQRKDSSEVLAASIITAP
jgi:hypothetical protein